MLGWLSAWDLWLCLVCNRSASRGVVAWLRIAGRVGDGPLWAVLACPVWLVDGWDGVGRLAGSLATAGLVYRLAKRWTARPRPHVVCADVRMLAAPLDRYSFPSGHTLHAVSTAVVVGALVPGSAAVLGPLAAAIAASRVVLGLHYPSDVVAGAVIGAGIGLVWVAVRA